MADGRVARRGGLGQWLGLGLLSLLLCLPARAALRWQTFLYAGAAHTVAAHEGRIWLGTSAGLLIFEPRENGVGIQSLGPSDGLPGAVITAVAFAPGALWAGTDSGQIGRLDLATNEWRQFDQQTNFPAAAVTDLVYDGSDVWAATLGGVARFNVLQQRWEVWDQSDGLPAPQVRGLVADDQGIWAATDQGLARYVRKTLSWHNLGAGAPRLAAPVRHLALGGNRLWLAGADTLVSRLDTRTGELATFDLGRQYGVGSVDRVLAAANGDLWFATDRGVVQAREQGEGPWRLVPRPPWQVTGLADQGGTLWISTLRDGVWQYRPDAEQWQAYPLPEQLPADDVVTAAPLAQHAWLGFQQHGVARCDALSGMCEAVPTRDGRPRQVRQLAAFGHYVYAAGLDGLAAYDQRTQTWQTYTTEFNSALGGDEWTSVLVQGGTVWVAGPGRVAAFDLDMRHRQTYQVEDAGGDRTGRFPRLVGDPQQGDVWLVTRTSAWRHRPANGTWLLLDSRYFAPADEAAYQREGYLIRDVASDADAVWFVTLDQVAEYQKQTNQFVLWDATAARSWDHPRLIATDKFSVWVAADNGLARFQRQTRTWQQFDWPPELAGEQPTALAVDAEEPYVWVSTARLTARLDLRQRESRWQVFPARTGLVSGVTHILPGRDLVWLVARGGASVYRRELGEAAPAAR